MKNFILTAIVALSCFVLVPSVGSAQAKAGWSEFSGLFTDMKVPYSCCTTFPVADNGVLPSFKSIPAKYLSVDGFFNEPSGRAFAVGKFKVSEKVVALVVYTDNSGTMGENKSYRLFTFDSKTGSFLNACQLAAKMTTIDGGTLLSSVSSSSTVSGDFQINCDYNAMKAGKSVSQVIKMVIRPDGSIETVTQ